MKEDVVEGMQGAHTGDITVVRPDGVLGAGEMSLVRSRIEGAIAKGVVLFDLTRITGLSDVALAQLAELMQQVGAQSLAVLGLGDHQRRILNYLGVDVAAFERRGARQATAEM